MKKKLSRREALVAMGAGATIIASPIASGSTLPKEQKATVVVLPVSGNNPIVIAPDDGWPTIEKSLDVYASNEGTASGTFRIRLAKVDSNGAIIFINLYGFGTNATVSPDTPLAPSGAVLVNFYFDNKTAAFNDYSLLVLMQEKIAPNTYVTRKIDTTQLHYLSTNENANAK